MGFTGCPFKIQPRLVGALGLDRLKVEAVGTPGSEEITVLSKD